MATWRDEIRTASQKEHYIREYLGIKAPKSSTEYRSAYQRLRFYAQGKTQTPKDAKYTRIKDAAEAKAEARQETRREENRVLKETRYGSWEQVPYTDAEINRTIGKKVRLFDVTLEISNNEEHRQQITSFPITNRAMAVAALDGDWLIAFYGTWTAASAKIIRWSGDGELV